VKITKKSLKETIRKVVSEYIQGVDSEELLDEGRVKKVMVRGGKKVKKWKADRGQKMAGGRAVRMKAAERIKRKRGAKRAVIKKKGKQARITRKRNKSMKKRARLGL